MFPGGPKLTLVGCEWSEVLADESPTGLVVVRSNPGGNFFNTDAKYARLNHCVPYNIALLPMDIEDRECKDFCVVDRYRKMGWGIDNIVL